MILRRKTECLLLSKVFVLGNLIMSLTTAANITWRFSRCTHLAKPGSSMLKSLLSGCAVTFTMKLCPPFLRRFCSPGCSKQALNALLQASSDGSHAGLTDFSQSPEADGSFQTACHVLLRAWITFAKCKTSVFTWLSQRVSSHRTDPS